tara:strand:- start:458 stop:772 length:315 start_codon:yes stop_codon:yes gene_type:complete
MENENSWSEIKNNLGEITNKIKEKIDQEELVDDLKDSFSSTVENTSKLLNNMLRTIESTVSDDEIKNEAKEVIQNVNEELKNLIDETKNKYLRLFEDNFKQEEE